MFFMKLRAPSFDYGDMPSPLGESESTITVLLRPAQGRGAPISTYQVVVEEDRPKKIKRELGGQECFPVPLTFDDAMSRGSVHYFGAELPPSSLPEAKPFTVGDNQTYSGYWNPPLEPKKAYLIYFQAMSNLKGANATHTNNSASLQPDELFPRNKSNLTVQRFYPLSRWISFKIAGVFGVPSSESLMSGVDIFQQLPSLQRSWEER
uniref:Uncharacterized protein n=1 Tax=Sphaerodactylus townsendi TaxID=933632 RepID=A0ACB8FSX1_9SAUR